MEDVNRGHLIKVHTYTFIDGALEPWEKEVDERIREIAIEYLCSIVLPNRDQRCGAGEGRLSGSSS